MLSAFLLFTVCACYCQARQRHQQRQGQYRDEEASVELLEENWQKPPPEDDYEPLPEYASDNAPEYAAIITSPEPQLAQEPS